MKNRLLMTLCKSRKTMALLMLLSIMPMLSGCYGHFPLTRAVYKINGEITDNKFVHSVMMWVFVIVPVYGFASLGDAIILNLIEFWTGEQVKLSVQNNPDGSKINLVPGASQNEADLIITQADGKRQNLHFMRGDKGVVQVLNTEGTLVGRVVKAPSGAMLLQDANGMTLRTLQVSAATSL